MESLGIPGIYTFTQQGYITPTGSDYGVRVYSVNFKSSGTNTVLTLTNSSGGTTASALTTNPILAVHDNYSSIGLMSSERGYLFTNGCFVQTASGLTWGSIVYALEYYG